MSYMSLFRPTTNNIRIVDFNQDYYGNTSIQDESYAMNDIPLAIFNLTEMGPSVLYRDFDELKGSNLDETDLTTKINTLAANLIAATGSGHTYNEGCFDIKMDSKSEFRLFVIAIKRPNKKYVDPRIKSGYFHVVLFIPQDLALTLPSISKMEDELFGIVGKNMKNSEDFNPKKINKLKRKLIQKIIEYRI
ncbi:MAG: hypothetical protein GPJ54_04820 [Candidatus Heimdallarchaeota archaeon]|nr:hypothetical protein [Candidatus Heimdallarchaeota archaeon]